MKLVGILHIHNSLTIFLYFTEAAMEFFQDAAPRKLGRVDPYFAASTVR